LVREPGGRGAPEESAAGRSPRHCINARGVSKRRRAPMSAPMVTATGHGTPRSASRAAPPGGHRQTCTCSWSAGARRWRRAGCAGTARPYSGNTRCCAGGGQTTSESHRRGAGRPGARPVERLACRRQNAWRRNGAAWRALRGSARARRRSRLASAATVGTATAGSSPERARRARGPAARWSVWTRSPAVLGRREGATTQPSAPVWVLPRARPSPQGPAASSTSTGLACDGSWRRRGSRSPGRVPMGPREVTSAP
jgi:hypothetical protein